MLMLVVWLLFSIAVVACVACLVLGDESPGRVRGVYAVPGRWYYPKYALARLILSAARRRALHGRRVGGSLGLLRVKLAELKRREFDIDVPQNVQGNNSVYVNASDQTGGTRLVVRVAVRPDDRREVWFLLRLPGVGDLVLPQHPDCAVSHVRGEGFTGAGVTCTPVEGMLTWRIAYNGLCRVGIRQDWAEEDDRPVVHLRCTLLWSAYSRCFDFSTDVHPSAAAANVAKETFSTQLYHVLREALHPDTYSQFGAVHGTVQVDDKPEETIYLRGIKERSKGTRSWSDYHSYIKNYIVLNNGTSLYLEGSCIPGQLSNSTCGYLVTPYGRVFSAVSTDLSLGELVDDTGEVERSFCYTAKFENGRSFHVRVEVEQVVCFRMGDSWMATVCEGFSRFKVNGVPGRGVCQSLRRYDGGRAVPPVEQLPRVYIEPGQIPASDYKAWVLPLDSPSCRLSSLTGGKGSQLAMLTSIQKEFEVPFGFCITTAAFKQHQQNNRVLREAVKELSGVARNMRKGDLKAVCEKTVRIFSETELSSDMKKVIADQFEKIFGVAGNTKAFAVRSSAVGEDTSQMSAAGQMDTYLGLKGIEKVLAKTQGCWASQFSFQAVQYRRQYGQTVESAMAVVVQEIVHAESAGVVFSRDPMTGNPSRVVITANYGLGESVVSGVSEADTVTLQVPEGGRHLSIYEKAIGRKKEAIVVSDKGGTEVAKIPEGQSTTCAVSDELCFKLGRIALLLDACFGDARDIEWAAVGDRVYLLQARAITTFDVPTRYDLLHEFDSGVSTDQLCLTTANIQEVCPGGMTPLTMSMFSYSMDLGFQLQFLSVGGMKLCSPVAKMGYRFYGQVFLSLSHMIDSMQLGFSSSPKEIGISLCGQALDEKALAVDTSDRPNVLMRMYNTCRTFHLLYNASAATERDFSVFSQHLTKHWATAQEQYDDISLNRYDSAMMLEHHLHTSAKSSAYRAMVEAQLHKFLKKQEVDEELNMLFSSCPEVESAKVPREMEQVASAIKRAGMGQAFQSMSREDAVEWLKTDMDTSGSAGNQFAAFLKTHGHRCIKESELHEKSWGMDPTQVIPAIQAILSGPSTDNTLGKKYLTVNEAIDSLKPEVQSWLTRKILTGTVDRARKAVAGRERSKSMTMKTTHLVKEAYWRLAHLMVQEGRIPEADLLFYFTHDEIGRILGNRSPGLIARALRRRRVHPEQDAFNFPLFITGVPTPVLSRLSNDETTTDLKLHGMPISNGRVKAKATVVIAPEEASIIKRGDILVTRITDIGWSPYFPLLGGLVTEIGGVLSHGAVVAREYGVPCVVNVHGATTLIKTGDIIVLDGAKGTVEKVTASDS